MTPNQISSRQNPNHFENAIFDQKPAAADNLFSLQSWLRWTKGKDRFPPYCLHLSDSLKSLDMREEERGGRRSGEGGGGPQSNVQYWQTHCDESTEDVGFVLGEDEIIMQPFVAGPSCSSGYSHWAADCRRRQHSQRALRLELPVR